MREIKFRAWDEDAGLMLPTQDLSMPYDYWTWLGDRDVPIMQFTGLKDKNGTEIYEGDIWEWGSYVGVVKFEAAKWTFRISISKRSGHGPHFNLMAAKGAVIGNIHETPELLDAPLRGEKNAA